MAATPPKVEFRTAYGPKARSKLICPEKGRTKQSHKAECDINNILARFQRTGVLEFVNNRQAQWGDVTGIDYQNAMNLVAETKEHFAELPSNVRNRFNNDPVEYLDFVSDLGNTDEAIKLGLLERARPADDEPAKPAVEAEPAPEGP